MSVIKNICTNIPLRTAADC